MLNSLAGDSAIPEERLSRIFGLHWLPLEDRLKAISLPTPVGATSARSIEEKMNEALDLLRVIAKDSAAAEPGRQTRTPTRDRPRARPRVFIGSSTEGLEVAEALQEGLDRVAECTIWNQGVFAPSATTIESIVDVAVDFDYAILVLTPDDLVIKRGSTAPGPRDNILFELGLFTGILGRARTFMVLGREDQMSLPSDLMGVTVATYSRRSDRNLLAALGPVCTQIKRAMGVA
jgi:predicted nucleotide-binding protein